MFKRVILFLLALIVVGIAGVFVLAWHPSYEPIEPPAAASFDAGQVQRGEMLASAGYCATCHTAKGGARNAGGYPLKTGFGTIHSTNITPDPATGIGTWSEAAFARAMREGIARDGSELYPAFPFDHFTRLSDEDVAALYAYLMSQAAVSAPAKDNKLPFPLNIRALQAGWKLLFLDQGRFEPVAGKSEEWNRGAYLAEGLGHCGACHTPRNALGAEKSGEHVYAGAFIDGWTAPALNAAQAAPLAWNADELFGFLRRGGTALHGVAAGPMSEVVHEGLSALPDSDIHALATYFAEVNGSDARSAESNARLATLVESGAPDPRARYDEGADLYRSACAACHYNSAHPPALLRPELALNSALSEAVPTNFIRVVLHGVGIGEGIPGAMMPPFDRALSDPEIAAIAAYLRDTMTDKPAWTDLSTRIAAVRQGGSGS
ncbi:cytochrome c [Dokdonella immobilis]|uniref:Cytochrome c, mono-and diheme variants n=1 Tax=Dokdonella immobilis TaxID=578942 RepID=A0A1I5A5I1_9GAMM|nr:cytochrome c [Dokdonella immobilis]SFN57734.1 Cytochrome c, mono-and diheme variants [Dokdonella immobilis]